MADDLVWMDASGGDKEKAGVSRPQSPLSGASQQAGVPPKQPGSRGSGARKGGVSSSSASHLHRNMLDKSLHKKFKGMDASAAAAGKSSPLAREALPDLMHAPSSTRPQATMKVPPRGHVRAAASSPQGPHGAPESVMGATPAMAAVWTFPSGAC